jgi:hypothetical protein
MLRAADAENQQLRGKLHDCEVRIEQISSELQREKEKSTDLMYKVQRHEEAVDTERLGFEGGRKKLKMKLANLSKKYQESESQRSQLLSAVDHLKSEVDKFRAHLFRELDSDEHREAAFAFAELRAGLGLSRHWKTRRVVRFILKHCPGLSEAGPTPDLRLQIFALEKEISTLRESVAREGQSPDHVFAQPLR